MIYCLNGKILKKSLDQVVISCAGVGYQVQVPSSVAGALPAVGQEATLYTCMNVTESDVSLFGFADEEQQACFKMLTAVSGVGPKVGLAILSVLSPQRITLELKDKVGKGLAEGLSLSDLGPAAPAAGSNLAQAAAALTSLGYTSGEAAAALTKLDDTLPVEELIKLALRGMARR